MVEHICIRPHEAEDTVIPEIPFELSAHSHSYKPDSSLRSHVFLIISSNRYGLIFHSIR